MKKPIYKNKRSLLKEGFSGMKKNRKLKGTLIALVVLMMLSPKIIPVLASVTSDSPKEIAPPPLLDMVVLEPEKFEQQISATGNLMAKAHVDLSTEVSGKITALNITEGSEVKQGDLLMKINDLDLQAQLRGARSELKLLKTKEDRKRQLLEKGGATQEEYDAILSELNSKRAEIDLIQANIQKTEIRAPFDGILGLRQVDPGAYVTPNVTVASIQDLSEIKIEFSIPERYATAIETGSEIRYKIQGMDSIFTGNVYAIEPQIDTHSRTFRVRAISDNEEGLLQPGSYAEINLVLEAFDNALMLPSVALIPEGENFKVFAYQNGRAISKKVEVGLRNSEKVQILEGLKANDTILLNGFLQVEDSSRVAVRKIESYE